MILYCLQIRARSSADRVPGYEPVGRRFESCRARKTKDRSCTCLFVLLAPSWIRTWSRLCRESGSQVRRKPLSACKHKARRDSLPTAMYPAKLQSNFRALTHGYLRQVLYLSFCFTCLGEDSPWSRLCRESGADAKP